MSPSLEMGPRRGWVLDLATCDPVSGTQAEPALLTAFEDLDLAYRTLVAILYNGVPTSGHPGGSISAGHVLHGLLYGCLELDLADPDRPDADVLVLAAGHKALGLYVAWALRDELTRIHAPEQLPTDPARRLRLEDLMGFRKNPTQKSRLLERLRAKRLDGHPTPATPFVKLATGASGVGVPAGFGLAWAANDLYPDDPPRVHLIEGEGGLTPGRVAEAMSAAAIAGLSNVVLHVDWNQASIDSNRVCGDGGQPGDYVPWNPVELAHFHDFNVLLVEDGLDMGQVLRALATWRSRQADNRQPSCIVYRTIKGWRYGIEGRASHGAGHGCCSAGFYDSLKEFEQRSGQAFERLEQAPDRESLEANQWEMLSSIRSWLESEADRLAPLGQALDAAKRRLDARARSKRTPAPDVGRLFHPGALSPHDPPHGLECAPGTRTTLRESLGRCLAELNRQSDGALVVASADLAASTSISLACEDFGPGFYHSETNPKARLLALGGICEDAMGAWLSAVSAGGRHLGVSSSYGAFIAALQHVPARLHAIAQAAKRDTFGDPVKPYLLVCAHAGLKTGEDGPTHADPQCLQLLQDNFPPGSMITLTPWDPNEIWPCLVAGLQARPAVLAPFVTRPAETIVDRLSLGLPPAAAAAKGLYPMRTANPTGPRHGTLVLQGSGVATTFVQQVLPRMDQAGLNLGVYYVSSVELFDQLPEAERRQLWPAGRGRETMGITGFGLASLHRWVGTQAGRRASLHAFKQGGFAGSGPAEHVLAQAGLDAESQWRAIGAWAEQMQAEG